MKNKMKKTFFIFSGLTALLLTAALVIVFYILNINPNEHKQWLTEKFTQETGRNLTLQGDIAITFYPWLGVELNQVTISNAPGFGDEPMFYTEHAQLRVKLLPLLEQQYEIDTVRLLGSRINLTINPDGKTNWADLLNRTPSKNTDDSSQKATTNSINLNNIALGGVEIKNTNIRFDDLSADLHYTLNDIDIAIGELQYGQPIQARFNLSAGASTAQLSAQSQLSGSAIYDLNSQTYALSPLSLNGTIIGPDIPNGSTPIILQTALSANFNDATFSLDSLELEALGTHLKAAATGRNIQSNTPIIDGSLRINGPDLSGLLEIAGQFQGGEKSPLSQYAKQLKSVSNQDFNLNADFTANFESGNIDVPLLNAKLLGFSLNGKFNTQNIQDNNGSLDGSLSLSSDTLGEVLEAIGQQELAEVVHSIDIDVQASGKPENLQLSPFSLDLVLSGAQIPNSPVSLALTANSSINLNAETLKMNNFTLKGLGIDVDGSLNANNIFSQPDFNGNLSIEAFNPRQLLKQLKQSLPDTADPSVFQKLSLSSNFSASLDSSATSLELSSLAVTIDDSNILGQLSLENFKQPAFNISISIDQLNADRYLPPSSNAKPDTSKAENSDLPMDILRQLNAKGELSIQQLQISNLKLNEFFLAFDANNSQLSLSPLSMNLYQGAYSGTLKLDTRDTTPNISIDSNLQNIALEPLMVDFMGSSYVSGTGNINFALTGRGSNIPSLKRSLSGSGHIEILDGVFSGVDIGDVLTQVETMIRSQKLMDIQTGEQTAFNSFSGTIAINKGLVRSDDLLIAAPGFQVAGRGTLIDLKNDSIQYDLTTTIDPTSATRDSEEYDIGGYSLPITCSGTITSPSCLPDVEEIIKQTLGRAISRGLSDLLQDALGGETTPKDNLTESSEEEQIDPGSVLLNRALESLFK